MDMTPPTSRPEFRDGTIHFASAELFEREVQLMLSHGLIWVGGDDLPTPLEIFPFRLRAPTGSHVSMTGQIVSRRAQEALIELHTGANELFRTLLDMRYPGHRADKRRFAR